LALVYRQPPDRSATDLLLGYPLFFLLLTHLRMNSLLLVSKSNFLEQATIHSIPLFLQAAFVLFLLNILPSPIRSQSSYYFQFQSPAILINPVVSILTVILEQINRLQRTHNSLVCTVVKAHHTYPQISALAQD